KLKGQLAWHRHEYEDELFHVIQGRLSIQLEGDREVVVTAGGFFFLPRGVMHNPLSEGEGWVGLIGDVAEKHTGNVEIAFTQDDQTSTRIPAIGIDPAP